MAEQKPVDVSKKYPSTDDLSRLPVKQQKDRLGAQAENQDPQSQAQRTKAPQPQGNGRRASAMQSPPQRTLTDAERQQRMEAFQRAASQQGPTPPFEQQQAQDDPSWTPQQVGQGMRQPDGGPHEGFERRMQRTLAAPHPAGVDYDRDGYGDNGAGRSARSQQNWHSRMDRAAQVQAAVPQQADRNRDGYPDNSAPGVDGFRQDQVGYRQRLRARREIANEQLPEGEPQLQIIDRPLPGDHTPNQMGRPGQATTLADLTPLAQAMIAPANPRTSPNAKAVQVSNSGPPRMDGQGQPTQATLDDQGNAVIVSDPQGHAPPQGTANNPITGDVQVSLPEGEPNPVSPAPTGGPAQPPLAHASTPVPDSAKASPGSVSPAVAPAQQNIPGQQHSTAQQAPGQQPQSRFAPNSPNPPAENAPTPADTPARNASQGKAGA